MQYSTDPQQRTSTSLLTPQQSVVGLERSKLGYASHAVWNLCMSLIYAMLT